MWSSLRPLKGVPFGYVIRRGNGRLLFQYHKPPGPSALVVRRNASTFHRAPLGLGKVGLVVGSMGAGAIAYVHNRVTGMKRFLIYSIFFISTGLFLSDDSK